MLEFILKHWLTVLFGGIATMFMALYTGGRAKARKDRERMVAVERGVQALLRDRIYQACTHYEDKGFMPIYARENLEEMLKEYENLGGNGTLKSRVERVLDELPFDRK